MLRALNMHADKHPDKAQTRKNASLAADNFFGSGKLSAGHFQVQHISSHKMQYLTFNIITLSTVLYNTQSFHLY